MSQNTHAGASPVREQLRGYVPHEHEELQAYARRTRGRKHVPSVVIVKSKTERTP